MTSPGRQSASHAPHGRAATDLAPITKSDHPTPERARERTGVRRSERISERVRESALLLERAVDTAKQNEQGLRSLLDALDRFSSGLAEARAANDALLRNLDGSRGLIEGANEHRVGLENEVRALKTRIKLREREFEKLMLEQDDFLRGLLDEHEEELAALRRERDEALERLDSAERSAIGDHQHDVVSQLRGQIIKLRIERESARQLVERMRVQRDRAQQRLADSEGAFPATSREAETEAPPPTDSWPLELAPESGSGAHPTTPAPPPFPDEHAIGSTSSPEDEIAGNFHVPRQDPPPTELAAVILRQTPAPPSSSERPSGGYSLQPDGPGDPNRRRRS